MYSLREQNFFKKCISLSTVELKGGKKPNDIKYVHLNNLKNPEDPIDRNISVTHVGPRTRKSLALRSLSFQHCLSRLCEAPH